MSEIFGTVMTFLPLIVVAWIANIAEARREKGEPHGGMALFAYILVVVMYGATFLVGFFLQIVAFVALVNQTILAGPLANFPADSMQLLALGLWLPSILGIILLFPPVRKLVARFIKIDPESPVHAVSLSLSMLAIINLLVTLGVGLGTFADLLAEQGSANENTILVLWVQQVLTALLAAIGVGWFTRRDWRQTLLRLGLVVPTRRQVLIGIACGLAMVPVVLLIEALSAQLGFGADADVERLTQQLLGPLFTSPLGILTLGLSAALGEETLFRGAILPRFGLILSAAFFALLHSQYGITLSTLVVFVLGLVLGLLRTRYNTSTSMTTHATYNMSLGLIAYLSLFITG